MSESVTDKGSQCNDRTWVHWHFRFGCKYISARKFINAKMQHICAFWGKILELAASRNFISFYWEKKLNFLW